MNKTAVFYIKIKLMMMPNYTEKIYLVVSVNRIFDRTESIGSTTEFNR